MRTRRTHHQQAYGTPEEPPGKPTPSPKCGKPTHTPGPSRKRSKAWTLMPLAILAATAGAAGAPPQETRAEKNTAWTLAEAKDRWGEPTGEIMLSCDAHGTFDNPAGSGMKLTVRCLLDLKHLNTQYALMENGRMPGPSPTEKQYRVSLRVDGADGAPAEAEGTATLPKGGTLIQPDRKTFAAILTNNGLHKGYKIIITETRYPRTYRFTVPPLDDEIIEEWGHALDEYAAKVETAVAPLKQDTPPPKWTGMAFKGGEPLFTSTAAGTFDSNGMTGQPLERIERDVERDFFMSAEEALAYGIIDEIFQPRQ